MKHPDEQDLPALMRYLSEMIGTDPDTVAPDESFRVSQPEWRTLPDGSRAMELSVDWGGEIPDAWKREARRTAFGVGKTIIDDRIQAIQAQVASLQADVQAFYDMADKLTQTDPTT
jgi:hypothetical protein